MTDRAMRAIVTAPGQVRLEAFDMPRPGPGELLLRTRKTLISPGTERAILLNLPGKNVRYPREVGYCNVGQIIEVGSGLPDFYAQIRVVSRARHASHVLVKAEDCQVLNPGELGDARATFVPLLATALQAVRKTRIEIGETAAVIGLGPLGLLTLQALKQAGAIDIFALDRHEGRLQLASRLGADHCLCVDDDGAMSSLRGAAGDIPVVIEATGNPAAIELACEIAADGGRVALLGSARGKTASFDFYSLVHRKSITLIGAHISSARRKESAPGRWRLQAEHELALKLLEKERVQVEPLISHRFGWRQFEDAYALLARRDLDAIGILVDWTSN